MNVVKEIIIFWLETLLIPVLGIRPTLLVMDLLRSHKTSPVRDVLQAHDITLSLVPGVTLGLYRNRSIENQRYQATFDNSPQNNLRSCVWVFGGSVGEDVRPDFPLGQKSSIFYLSEAVVRDGDSDLDSPEVHGPCG